MEWTAGGQARLHLAKRHHTEAMEAIATRQFPVAKRMLLEALRLRRNVLPSDHPLVLLTRDAVAQLHITLGEKREALAMLMDLIPSAVQRLESVHVDVENMRAKAILLATELNDGATASKLSGDVWNARVSAVSASSSVDQVDLFDETFSGLPLPQGFVDRQARAPLAPTEERVIRSSLLDNEELLKKFTTVPALSQAARVAVAPRRSGTLDGGGGGPAIQKSSSMFIDEVVALRSESSHSITDSPQIAARLAPQASLAPVASSFSVEDSILTQMSTVVPPPLGSPDEALLPEDEPEWASRL